MTGYNLKRTEVKALIMEALRGSIVALLGLGIGLARAGAQTPASWNLELPGDQQARTTVTAANRCLSPHVFEVSKSPAMNWFRFVSGARVEVSAGGTSTVDVTIDTAGLLVGVYQGEVSVKCLGCAKEPTCTQDTDRFLARLKVLWPEKDLRDFESEEFVPGQVMALFETERDADRFEAEAKLVRLQKFALRSLGWTAVLFALPASQTPAAAIARFQGRRDVLFLQPNYLYPLAEQGHDDPYGSLQYGPRQLKADRAHRFATGKKVRIAVLDSGVDIRHKDLKGRVVEAASFIGKGRSVQPDVHGTAIAGVVAARADNGFGIYGIAPESELVAIEVCEPKSPGAAEAACRSFNLAQGLDFAISVAARVVNLSLAGPKDPLVTKLVETAIDRGSVVVAAAGNDGPKGRPRYPAALPRVLAVSAIDSKEALYQSANRGNYVDLVAPGVEILSTAPGNRFHPYTGTSFATAHVTGLVALLLQMRPELTPEEITALLETTARDLGDSGKDELFGSGAVDACRALEKLAGRGKLCN